MYYEYIAIEYSGYFRYLDFYWDYDISNVTTLKYGESIYVLNIIDYNSSIY